MIVCLPVKNGWQLPQTSTRSSVRVDPTVHSVPQDPQWTFASWYLGWMSLFTGVLLGAVRTGSRCPAGGRRSGVSRSGLGRDRRGGLDRDDSDALLCLGGELELHLAGDRGEDRVVVAEAGPVSRQKGHSTLADDDRPRRDELAVAGLDAEPLTNAVAAVLRGAASLLVGHLDYSSFFAVRLRLGFSVGASGSVDDAFTTLGFVVFAIAGSAFAVFAALVVPAPLARLALPDAVALEPGTFLSALPAMSATVACGAGGASFAASAASASAWRFAPSSSRWRSVRLASAALATSAAALRPPSTMSLIRRTVSSCRWPFLTRRRALGRDLKLMSFSPRVCRTTSAATEAFSTSGRPISAVSPSATRSTRSSVMASPGATSRGSTSSSVPTSTRYCFPPVSMTAYMDPLRTWLVVARLK